MANGLNLQSRLGRVNRGYFADLLFFADVPDHDGNQAVDWKKLSRVMVSGETVWENGKRTDGSPGIFLQRI